MLTGLCQDGLEPSDDGMYPEQDGYDAEGLPMPDHAMDLAADEYGGELGYGDEYYDAVVRIQSLHRGNMGRSKVACRAHLVHAI